MVITAGATRFVSDVHLRPERPDITERFSRFLVDCIEKRIAALFILGDLFEYWIGDDNLDDTFNALVASKLRKVSDAGVKLFFLQGNRDFLIGTAFAAATGAHLLPEVAVLGLHPLSVGADGTPPDAGTAASAPILLLHGDTLCTDDRAYQDFRRQVRKPEWQQGFLTQSLPDRQNEVNLLRQRSTEAVRQKSAEIMDVNAGAVRRLCAEYHCRILIHGHTHRPGCELLDTEPPCERWVLSDWEHDRGDALETHGQKIRRLDWSQ